MYDDDEALKDSAKKLVSKGVKISEVFSPFPIHGIDPIIGIKNTRLGIMAFLYGITGLTVATLGMRYFMVTDWPMNIGGKPNFALPAWIPITFELTVLFAAISMVVAFFIRCGLSITASPKIYDERTTDYLFGVAIKVTEDTTPDDYSRINDTFTKTGVTEIKVRDFDEDK